MDSGDVAALAAATAKLRSQPALIHKPELGFFREFLLSWSGVKLAESGKKASEPEKPSEATTKVLASSPVAIDSDDELEAQEVPAVTTIQNGKSATEVSPASKRGGAAVDVADSDDEDPERMPEESEPPPPMPPCGNLEPSEAEMEACRAAKQLADEASDVGDALGALRRLSEAVMSGGAGALLFARRAEMLLQLRRPKAAILDCAAALEVNPECGKAYRIRGIAHRRLGRWEAAQKDLLQGQKLDHDENATQVQKFVEEKLKQLAAKKKQPAAKNAGKPPSKRAKVL
jgi:suppressor of tumorigenicity protein 13